MMKFFTFSLKLWIEPLWLGLVYVWLLWFAFSFIILFDGIIHILLIIPRVLCTTQINQWNKHKKDKRNTNAVQSNISSIQSILVHIQSCYYGFDGCCGQSLPVHFGYLLLVVPSALSEYSLSCAIRPLNCYENEHCIKF